MNIEIKGKFDRDEEIIDKLPVNLKKYVEEFGSDEEEIKKRNEYINDKVKLYRDKGYSNFEIEVSEEYIFSFGEIGVEVQKKIIVGTLHTQQSWIYHESTMFYTDSDYSKERNVVGFEIKKVVEEVYEDEED